jgi:hypothetical protein
MERITLDELCEKKVTKLNELIDFIKMNIKERTIAINYSSCDGICIGFLNNKQI